MPLVLVADAMWYRIAGEKFTVYITLLKAIDENKAFVLMPTIVPGHECTDGWREALWRIPPDVFPLIRAVVSDGVKSLHCVTSQFPWVHQRCHFHLLNSVQNYATTGPRSAQPELAAFLMKTAKTIIATTDKVELERTIETACRIFNTTRSRGVRRVFRGLIRDLPEFRAYLDQPEFRLPTTSNAAESVMQYMRDLLYRARGFRSQGSFTRWITALLYVNRWINCNGSSSTELTS
jgi:hypothetical protein